MRPFLNIQPRLIPCSCRTTAPKEVPSKPTRSPTAPRDAADAPVGEALVVEGVAKNWPWRYRKMFGHPVCLCPPCFHQIGDDGFCPLCGVAYEDDEMNMMQCDDCKVCREGI